MAVGSITYKHKEYLDAWNVDFGSVPKLDFALNTTHSTIVFDLVEYLNKHSWLKKTFDQIPSLLTRIQNTDITNLLGLFIKYIEDTTYYWDGDLTLEKFYTYIAKQAAKQKKTAPFIEYNKLDAKKIKICMIAALETAALFAWFVHHPSLKSFQPFNNIRIFIHKGDYIAYGRPEGHAWCVIVNPNYSIYYSIDATHTKYFNLNNPDHRAALDDHYGPGELYKLLALHGQLPRPYLQLRDSINISAKYPKGVSPSDQIVDLANMSEKIAKLAYNKDAAQIESLLQHYCIDLISLYHVNGKKIGLTPTQIIVLENPQDFIKHDAMRILLMHGAQYLKIAQAAALLGNEVVCDNFLATYELYRSSIIWFAAFGGHLSYVEKLLRHNPSRETINSAVNGAAAGGYIPYARSLISRGGSWKALLHGITRSNDDHRATVICCHFQHDKKNFKSIITAAMAGAVFAGNHKFIAKWKEHRVDKDELVKNLALTGQEYATQQLIQEGANATIAIMHAMRGGHLWMVAKFLNHFQVSLALLVRAAAHGGHFAHADHLINQGANRSEAAIGAKLGSHHVYANKQVELGADPKYIEANMYKKMPVAAVKTPFRLITGALQNDFQVETSNSEISASTRVSNGSGW